MNNTVQQSESVPQTSKEKLSSIFLRLIVTLILLGFIVWSVDFTEVISLFNKIDYFWLLASCVVLFAGAVISAFRWQFLLASENIVISLKALVNILFVSQFIGHILPGTLGTEVVRGYEVVKKHGRVANVTATLLLDRVIGLYAMIVLAFIGAIFAEFTNLSLGLTSQLFGILALVTAGWAAACYLSPKIKALNLFKNTKLENFWLKLQVILFSITDIESLKRIFLRTFTISLLLQIVRSVLFFCIYRSLGSDVALAPFMIFVPLLFIALLFPISIGGLGVREGTLAYFFGLIGVPHEVSVGVGILTHILMIVVAIPSVILWVFDHHRKPLEAAPPVVETDISSVN